MPKGTSNYVRPAFSTVPDRWWCLPHFIADGRCPKQFQFPREGVDPLYLHTLKPDIRCP